MKKFLALLLLINCAYSYSSSDDTGPFQKTLREELERRNNDSTNSALKEYHEWAQTNLPSWLVGAYMDAEILKYCAVVFMMNEGGEDAVEVELVDRLKSINCLRFIFHVNSLYIQRQDPKDRDKLITEFESRYQECLKLNKDLGEKYRSKKE